MTSTWKKKLVKLEELTKNNSEAAYHTAVLIRDLLNDKEFVDQESNGKIDNAESRLAKYAGRFALSVTDMVTMIDVCPNIEDWKETRLDLIKDKACRHLLALQAKRRQPGIERHKKDFSTVKADLKETAKKLAAVTTQIVTKDRKIDELAEQKAAAAKLAAENAAKARQLEEENDRIERERIAAEQRAEREEEKRKQAEARAEAARAKAEAAAAEAKQLKQEAKKRPDAPTAAAQSGRFKTPAGYKLIKVSEYERLVGFEDKYNKLQKAFRKLQRSVEMAGV